MQYIVNTVDAWFSFSLYDQFSVVSKSVWRKICTGKLIYEVLIQIVEGDIYIQCDMYNETVFADQGGHDDYNVETRTDNSAGRLYY